MKKSEAAKMAALLGYTGGPTLRAVVGSDEDLQDVARQWRQSNPELVKLWRPQTS